jgi:alcohol dehydrogenase
MVPKEKSVCYEKFHLYYIIEYGEKMKALKEKARGLIQEFKKESYIHGLNCLEKIGTLTRGLGERVLLVTSLEERDPADYAALIDSLKKAGLQIVGQTPTARPNSPQEDVFRIENAILAKKPDVVLAASGGSGIDATKAAIVLACLGGDLEEYFGLGKVAEKVSSHGKGLLPFVALQTASGSAAHLTKYSNITDFRNFQKKLIIDETIVPSRSLFDYSLTRSMSASFTCDGAFDGLSHCMEVYFGARPEVYSRIEGIALTGIELTLASLEKAVAHPDDLDAREGLGLATDLGGYAIMVGGTNGPHITSFSLVDVLSHGRACAILNPYYTVLFSHATQKQLHKLVELLQKYGLAEQDCQELRGGELGKCAARGLIALSRRVGYPTTLGEIEGLTTEHITKAIQAAKDPQLRSKLQNMPIPLDAEDVDEYMLPVLESAWAGDFSRIKMIHKAGEKSNLK